MKQPYLIILICLIPCCTRAQIDSTFNLSQAVGYKMELEQQYSETKDVNVANELILLYKKITANHHFTTDHYTLALCRMLAEVHRYDEAIVLSDSLPEDKLLFKERLCLMKASYLNDTASFSLHISEILNYLDDFTLKHTEAEDSLMRISFDSGFSSEGIHILLMFQLKYCYLSVANGLEVTCQQLIDNAYKKGWDIDNLNWLLEYIRNFDYMSLTWW